MTQKLNKKQIRQVAKIWAGSMLWNLDFAEPDFMQMDEVLQEVQKIAVKILGDNPTLATLPEIVERVKSNV